MARGGGPCGDVAAARRAARGPDGPRPPIGTSCARAPCTSGINHRSAAVGSGGRRFREPLRPTRCSALGRAVSF